MPYRDEDDKRHLKIMGDLGQIIPLVCILGAPAPLLRDTIRKRKFGAELTASGNPSYKQRRRNGT